MSRPKLTTTYTTTSAAILRIGVCIQNRGEGGVKPAVAVAL